MSERSFDVVVIGGGPGGYVAAIRAAQLGLTAACIDERESLGGTCLNIGCIPSKALLQSSEKYHEVREGLAIHGIAPGDVKLDLAAMMRRKSAVVDSLTGGVDALFRKNKVTRFRGHGRLAGDGRVRITGEDGDTEVSAGAVILATGSDTVALPGVELDERTIVSSAGALALREVPAHLVVIGAGYIGLEMGSVWRRLGARVTCIEAVDRVLPGLDSDLSRAAHQEFQAQGFDFRLGTTVAGARHRTGSIRLGLERPGESGEAALDCDVVLVAVGRRPNTTGLGLDEASVQVDGKGFVKVDREYRTSIRTVYAIGDVIGEPMLAHKAQDEGVACANIIAGRSGYVNYRAIPSIIYTSPAIASVGNTEDELKEAEVDYRVGRFPFRSNGRAKCNADERGFVKILADRSSNTILGAHVFGREADTLIHEIVAAIQFGASAEELGQMCHGHPTLDEAVREASLAVVNRAIHG